MSEKNPPARLTRWRLAEVLAWSRNQLKPSAPVPLFAEIESIAERREKEGDV